MWQVIGTVAGHEHSLISARTRAGAKDAKKPEVKFGRKNKLAPAQITQARKLMEAAERVEDVAVFGNVARTTLYRALGFYVAPSGSHICIPPFVRFSIITP
jgi:DNA invertase Pin-like site-specific DNA recombinase